MKKNFGDDFNTFLIGRDLITNQKVMTFINAQFWKEAINSKFKSIIQNNIWVLADFTS